MEEHSVLFYVLKLIGSLSLFIYGMKIMSEALQKVAGNNLRSVLAAMTTNRFTGVLTGAFVTAAIQSSTATTVMIVSFVNAGVMSLAQAISVIMGANIGTTLTAWIMSAGFGSFNIMNLVFPAFFIALLLIYSKRRKSLGEFIFGVAFMFFGLGTLRQTGIDMRLGENPAVLSFFSSFDPDSFLTTLIFLLLGGVLTMAVQSSAAVMAITMILCSSGALPIYQGIALVMGENIGTTITSNIAALTANTQARRAALAHMFFNVFGVLWVLCVFRPFINMVCGMAGVDPLHIDAERLPIVLAAFHTTFNLCNTFVLIWFVPQIERLVTWVIKPKKESQAADDDFRLRFISGGLMSTSELSILQAWKEISVFGQRTHRMFDMVQQLYAVADDQEFVKLYSRIEKYENICDRLEVEIGGYLNRVSDGRLSERSKRQIHSMLRIVSELESVGDGNFNLARLLKHRFDGKAEFTPYMDDNIRMMFGLVENSIYQMTQTLGADGNIHPENLDQAHNIENEINNFRDQLKQQNIINISEKSYGYQTGIAYMDIISECEKTGDYVINVQEAVSAAAGISYVKS